MWCTMIFFGDMFFASDWVVPKTFESKNAVTFRTGSACNSSSSRFLDGFKYEKKTPKTLSLGGLYLSCVWGIIVFFPKLLKL